MLSVAHNLTAMNAQRQFNLTGGKLSKSSEKLSSGYKINRAADNAAGLAISEKMRRQIRGLTQASTNAQDGISMVQTAEGGLNEVHDMLQRANELAVQASNATNTEQDRIYIDSEFQNLKKEINRVADTTTFNEIQLFPSDGSTNIASYNINYSFDDGTVTLTDETQSYSSSVASTPAGASGLANYVANTLIPSATAAVLSTFSALDIGTGSFSVPLTIKYDKPGGTLAFASYSYYPSDYTLAGLSMTIDSADFNDANSLSPGSERYNLMLSTLNHEVTHTVMQSVLTKAMASELPKWFKEGTAQLGGGGFTTGWNNTLIDLTKDLTSENDTTNDTEIANYLKKYTVEGRPYGHGYLACAYMGYLASGGTGPVTSAKIASGINTILGDLKGGTSFEDSVKNRTGLTTSQLASKINNGDASAVEFVRKLSYLSNGGAGSILSTTALNANGYRYAGAPSASGGSSSVDAATTINLQVGSEAGQTLGVSLFSIGTVSLGIHDSNVLDFESAQAAIDEVKGAIEHVSNIRSYYGAIQNRLEHTINNLDNVVENTTAAESQIRDTDMATEMVAYSLQNILSQAGISMMSQANQSKQGVLTLLQ